MKNLYLVLTAIAVLFLSLISTEVKASHALGADITYSCANPANPNQYNIVVTFYRECGGGAIGAPNTISLSYRSASCGLGPFNVTLTQSGACLTPDGQAGGGAPASGGLCPAFANQTTCSGGTFPGAQRFTYCGTITLPGQCPDWVLSYSECCRNPQITNLVNPASNNQYVYALLNNTSGICNNSPFFTSPATRTLCDSFFVNYNHGAVDIDGDSLVFSLIQPLSAAGTPVAYSGGLSVTNPLNTLNGFNFDPATGQMSFTPVGGAQAAVITVLVEEYRNGVLIGSTMRDIQFKVVTSGCTPDSILPTQPVNLVGGGITVGPNNTPVIQVCPGVPLSFDLPYIDAAGSLITLNNNIAQSIPGASVSCATCNGTNDTAVLTFTWTPTAADSGLHFFTVDYSNNACPIQGGGINTFQIFVYTEVTIQTNSNTFCGIPLQLNAIGGSIFQWSPPTGLSNPNIPNPVASPTVPTFYTVTSDCGTDTITINIAQPFTLDAGADQTICLNGLAQLNAVPTGPGAPFSYSWSPSGPNTGLTTPTIQNPPVSPSVTTTYTVAATASNGCLREDTVRVTVQGVAPSITAFASLDTVCPGGTVQLDLTASPTVCGPSVRPCITNTVDYTLGTGTGFSTSVSAYPAIYGNFWESARHQILYQASELQAMGLTGGTLSSIAFDVAQVNNPSQYLNFSIKIACTSLNSITTFQGGLTTVVNPRTINITPGWNTYIFDTNYDWDGVSNIIVDVCFDNTSLGWDDNSPNRFTPTAFTSVVYYNTDGQNACNINTVDGTSANRPNARFGICQQGLMAGTTIEWSPAANMSDPNIANPLVRVFNTTNFIVDVIEGVCTGSAFVTVVVDDNLQLVAGPDTSICNPAPVTLTANASGIPSPITLTCGANGTACVSATNTYTLGTNAQTTNVTTPYKGADEQARLQYLVRGNELQAAGLTAGILSALSWNVSNKNTAQPFTAFTISIGCTNLDSLSVGTGFLTGLTPVFGPANVSTVAGVNTHTFAATYDWDGFSNLVVEINFNNGFGASIGEDIVRATPTTFGSVLFETFFFGAPSTPLTRSNLRPDITFTACPPPPGEFVYQWTPSTGLTHPITGLPTDTGRTVIANPGVSTEYIVEVTDGNCVAYDTVSIDFYSNFTANISIRNVGCFGNNDGDIIAEPVGGYAPFDFIWTDAGGNVIRTTIGQNTDTLLNLPIGTYYVELTDANGCSRLDTAEITVPSPLVINNLFSEDVTCFGLNNGIASAEGGGGVPPYTYSWSNGANIPNLISLPPGTYVLTVTDNSGCTVEDSVTITEPAEITFTKDSTLISCYQGSDGAAEIVITGGGNPPFTYLWSNAATTSSIQNLSAGTYSVTATDVEGCFVEATYNITAPDSFIIDITNVQDATCFNLTDGSASASVAGTTVGYSFLWSNGETTAIATALPAGTNTVTVTVDSSGCEQSTTVDVSFPPRFTLDITITNPVTCFGGSDGEATVMVSPVGGTPPFTYQWSNGQTDSLVIGLTGGETYYVTVTDGSPSGCPEFDTIFIPQPDPLELNPSITDVSCYGGEDGSIRIDPSGGTAPYSYSWSNGGTGAEQNTLPVGTYSVTVTDNQGCTNEINNMEIEEPLTPITWDTTVVDESCPGKGDGALFVTAAGGTGPYIFSLDNGNQTNGDGNFLRLSEGIYELAVIDANGCQVTGEIEIEAPPIFDLEFDPEFDTIQLGLTYVLTPIIVPSIGNYSFSWQPANSLDCDTCQAPLASPIQTTVYEVTVYDENNCPRVEQFTLFVENPLLLYIPNSFSPNGDGVNDKFQVYAPGAENVSMKIFNRWGEKVFDYNGDLNGGWDGTFAGRIAQIDVYVYYVEVIYGDGQKIAKEGSITIVK